jgi:hypothetical protein
VAEHGKPAFPNSVSHQRQVRTFWHWYQTAKWAERELEKIDASIPTRGFDAKQKNRRSGVRRRKAEAETTLAEINQRYDTDWAKLEALDTKAEALRKENAELLSRPDTYQKALALRLRVNETRRELADRIRQSSPDPAPRQTPTPPTKTAPFEPRQNQTHMRIRATLPGLTAALAREAAFQPTETENAPSSQPQVTATVSSAPGPQNSSPETELSSKKPADTGNAPEQLSESGNHTPPSAAKKKSPFNLPRRPKTTLK